MEEADLTRYYSILGVEQTTPLSQIRTARKRLLSEIHPDRFELSDPRRQDAEERAKEINQAFEGIRRSRAVPPRERVVLTPSSPSPQTPAPAKQSRKRLETVESKVVIRDGKVVLIKRKRPVKYALLKDIRDSARDVLLLTLDSIERRMSTLRGARSTPEPLDLRDKVVHIVEGKVSIEPI
jgi:hypothetical protein